MLQETSHKSTAVVQHDTTVIPSPVSVTPPRVLSRRIKWGSATRILSNRPASTASLTDNLVPMNSRPEAHDVFVAVVEKMGRHTGIELDCGRKAGFSEGDVIGVAFGHRYATRQFLGDVPPLMDRYDMLSQGGVCGRVLSAPASFKEPTVLRPLGYLANDYGQKTNLRDGALAPVETQRAKTLIVVGSSMDAGKTTAAASTVRGLCRSGLRVNAGKLTGTACAKDPLKMNDAGADRTLDFTSAGFASTAMATRSELEAIADSLITNLSVDSPDMLVLEIADGLIQRETKMLLDYLVSENLLDHIAVAVHDAMAAPACVDLLLRNWGLSPIFVSGAATVTPLSTQELQSLVQQPCLSKSELSDPEVAKLFSL